MAIIKIPPAAAKAPATSASAPAFSAVTRGAGNGGRAPPLAADESAEPVVGRVATAKGAEILGLPRAFWVLWVGMLINRLGASVVPFLSIYLVHQRGFSRGQAGLVLALYALGGMAAGTAGGTLADRWGRRPTLLLGAASSAAFMLALGFSPTSLAIFALVPLLGLCTELGRPPLQAAVADLVPAASRARAFGLIYWAINLGFSGAALVAGALAEVSFRLLFVLDAATSALFFAIIWRFLPETRPSGSSPSPVRGSRPTTPLRDPRLFSFLGIQLLALLAFHQVPGTLPLAMRQSGLPSHQVGQLLALNGLIIIVVQPLILRRLTQVPLARLLTVGTALVGLGLGINGLAGGAAVFAIGVLVWTLGEIAMFTATPAVIAELAPTDQRGAYQGAAQLAFGFTSAAAPIIGMALLGGPGPLVLWLGCLGAGLAAAALHATVTARVGRSGGAQAR